MDPSSPDRAAACPVETKFALRLNPQSFTENGLLRDPASRILFEHYLHRTHKIMAVCKGSRTPFVHELVPIAMSSRLVLNGLLAFSGIHYGDLIGGVNQEITWVHYGQAIQGLKYGLTQYMHGKSDDILSLVITTTILCIAEVSATRWTQAFLLTIHQSFRANAGTCALQHLKATRYLLTQALSLRESQIPSGVRAFLLERYVYTITLSHITMGQSSDEWVLDDIALLFPTTQTDTAHPNEILSGCVHEIFKFIPRVMVHARQLQLQKLHGEDIDEAIRVCASLRTEVAAWEPTVQEENYVLCGRIYQLAMCFYLDSILVQHVPQEEKEYYASSIGKFLDTGMPWLESISIDSPVSTTLCWPLAIFGACAKLAEHRKIIGDRLAQLSAWYSAPSVLETKKLLEILWSQDAHDHAGPLEFERIMRKEDLTVLFL